jgi:hypothetical protein
LGSQLFYSLCAGYIYICIYIYMLYCLNVHMWKTEVDVRCCQFLFAIFFEVALSLNVELPILAWWLTNKSLRFFCLNNQWIEFFNVQMHCHTWHLCSCWGCHLRSTWVCRKDLSHWITLTPHQTLLFFIDKQGQTRFTRVHINRLRNLRIYYLLKYILIF